MATEIGGRLPLTTIDKGVTKKDNNTVNNNTVTQPENKFPENKGNAAQDNAIKLSPNITKQPVAAPTIDFSSTAPVIVTARDIDIKVEDIDGIDTNSKNDLKAKITGNVSFSKAGIEDSLKKLEKTLNDKYPDCVVKLEANPATNEYEISINKGVKLGSVSLKMGPGGIDTKIELSGWTKAAGYMVSPLAMLYFKPEKMITDYVEHTLNKDLGMTTIPTGKNSFKLVPDFKNGHLQDLPVGNMKLHLETITASNSNFRLDPTGNMIMDLNVEGTASSNPYAQQAKDEGVHDIVSGKVDATYRTDGSAQAELKQGRLDLDITAQESDGLKQQLEGFGQKDIKASGHVTVSDVNTKTYVLPNRQVINQGVSSGNIEANNLKFEQGSNRVDLKSTQGTISYKPQDNGSFTVGVKGGISGDLTAKGSAINITDLNINGNLTYTPANGTPATYKIESDNISAKSINLNNTYIVKDLNVSNASIDINAAKGDITVNSKPGGKATINNLKMGTDLDLNKVNFSGSLKVESASGKVTINTNNLSFNGKLGEVNMSINPARGGNFAGKIVYDPATGVTVTGNNGKKNSSVTNLTGSVGGFKIDGLTAEGGFKLDNNNNLTMVSAGKFKLNASGMNVSGNNLVLSKNGDTIITNSGHNKLNLSVPVKGKSPEKIISDLVIDGNTNFDSKTNTISFNNPNSQLKFKSGSISGVNFNNFEPKGALQLTNDNKTITLKGPSSFTGVASIKDISVSNLTSDQDVIFDNNEPIKSLKLNGNVECDIKLPNQKETSKIATSGNIAITQENEKVVITSDNGSITGKFGNIDLDNFKFQGKVIYNTKTQEMKLEKLNDNTELSFNGKFNGADVNVKSPSGSLGMKKDGENYVVTAGDVKLNGNVGGMNFNAEKGISGEITIPPDDKPFVKNLDMEVEVEGVKFTGKGSSAANKDGGYQIDLSGGIQADNGKLSRLIDKIADSPYASSPEAKTKLNDLKQVLSRVDLTKLKFEDFKINFDKDMNYDMTMTASELAVNIPERDLKIDSLPPGKITLHLDNKSNISVSSTEGTNINASLGSTKFENFNLKGAINFTSPSQGNPEKIIFSKNNLNIENTEVSGNIRFGNDVKKVKFQGNADISMVKNGSDLEFQGTNMNIEGMFDGFNVKSLPTGNEGTANPTFASGKVIIKDNGRIDLSDLKFKLLVDGITVANNTGSVTTNEKGYEIKMSGDVSTNITNFSAFLKKLSTNTIVPDSARESITRTINNLHNYVLKGDLQNAKYKDMVVNIDRELNIKDFHFNTVASITNAKIKLDLAGTSNVLNFDKIDIDATSQSMDEKNLFIKNGKVHFTINDTLKASVSDAVKKIIGNNLGLPAEKLKDMKVDMTPEGKIVIGGSVNYKSIANVDLGATLSIDGTKVSFEMDKARLRGLFGLIQSVIQPVTGKAEQIITDKIVDNAAQNVKVEYAGKENVFSIDLQNIFSKYVNDNAKLKDIKVQNNEVNVGYEITYGSERKYNLANVQNASEQLNLVAFPKDKKKADANAVTNNILALSPQDLSGTFNRVSIVPDLIKRLGEKNTVAIMNKLANSAGTGSNGEHLRQFINEKNISTKVIQYFLKNLSREQYQALPVEVTDALRDRLVKK